MNMQSLLPLLVSISAVGCVIGDHDPTGANGTDGGVLISDIDSSLETLALNCNYRALFLTALEAADDAQSPPSNAEMYQVTDQCLALVEQTLIDHGVVLDFAGPLETDVNRRAVMAGVHSMFFSPMFTPPPVAGVPQVFDIENTNNPYPSVLAAIIPEVPGSYTFEIPADYYNAEIAQSFVANIGAIEDHTAVGASAVAKLVGTTIEIHSQFDWRYTNDPHKAAAVLVHEAAHLGLPGHKSCEVQSAACGGALPSLGADCDCSYEQSPYWIEAAFTEAAALGRVVSFAPGATHPIDGGTVVVGKFPAARCNDASKHVTPFRETRPRCVVISSALAAAIEANSDYWEGL